MKHTVTALLSATAVIALLTSPTLQSAALLASAISFEEGNLKLFNGANVVNGGIEVDTTRDDIDFHEYFATVPANVKFVPGKRYSVSYDYTVRKLGDDSARFYHFARHIKENGLKDLGVEYWTDTEGGAGHKEFEFTADPQSEGYKVVLGVRFKGAVRIENLKIAEVE